MLRWIARQYLTGLRGDGTRKGQKGMNIFWIVYAFFVIPSIWGLYDTGMGAARYLVLAVPMAWCTIESMLSPIRMPKLLFLCSMDKAMRKGYIQGSFLFRVVIHTALGVLGAVLSMALGNDWLGAMGVSLNIFLYSLLCVGVDATVSTQRGEDYDTSNWGRVAVRVTGTVLVMILQMIYVFAAKTGGMMAQARWEQILIGCLTTLVILFTARYVGYWTRMQEEALSKS